MKAPEIFDVAVVGAGITGLSTVLHLNGLGLKNVALISDKASEPATNTAMGLISGGFADNFTRLSHAHGSGVGGDLWRFGDRAFDALVSFCQNNTVTVLT